MKTWFRTAQQRIRSGMDTLAFVLQQPDGKEFSRQPRRNQKDLFLAPEEDVKKLIISATSLDHIWTFLIKRLRSGSEPSFMLFSVVDEVAELLRLKFLWPQRDDKSFQGEFIPLCDTSNHLIKTVLRSDTTFTDDLQALGRELYPYLEGHDAEKHNVFSVPLMAGNRTIAVVTLGFDALDSFSQAKLSYLYLLRDQIAQVVWNLILQERIQNHPQLDNLTGLVTYSSFHQVFQKELRRAKFEGYSLCLLLVDINDLRAYNEQFSHQMGDLAIARLASIIKHQVRGIDTIARYGNDEIAIILPESDPTDAAVIGERITTALNTPHARVKPFQVNVGVTCYPTDSTHPEGLIQLAENAVQYAKQQHVPHAPQSQIQLASELNQASDQERLDVFSAQIARKYGHSSSELFETLMNRIADETELGMDNLMLETVVSLAAAIDTKDNYAPGHSQAMANYSVALAHAIGLPPLEVEKIRLAAFFHDVGKIGIPETILNKTGPLTQAEKSLMDQHAMIGARQILQPVTALNDILPLVEYHHERWDGEGHPVGLRGENIPVGARIIAIVDTFLALTSNRPYRAALALEDALVILQDGAGSQWDPELIGTFFKILERMAVQSHSLTNPAETHSPESLTA